MGKRATFRFVDGQSRKFSVNVRLPSRSFLKKLFLFTGTCAATAGLIYSHRDSICRRILSMLESRIFVVTEGIRLSCESFAFTSPNSAIFSNGKLALAGHDAGHDAGGDGDDDEIRRLALLRLNNFSFFDLDFDSLIVSWSWKRLLLALAQDAVDVAVDAVKSAAALDVVGDNNSNDNKRDKSKDYGITGVQVEHVRGVIDRRHVFWDISSKDADLESSSSSPSSSALHTYYAQIKDRNRRFCENLPTLFDVSARDILISVLHPDGFRPFQISILSLELDRLRPSWIMHDLLTARSMVGLYDNCLFSLHAPQTSSQNQGEREEQEEEEEEERLLKIDNVPLYHVISSDSNSDPDGDGGPLRWIKHGSVDISLLMKFPVAFHGQSQLRSSLSDVLFDRFNEIRTRLKEKKQLSSELKAPIAVGNDDNKEDNEESELQLDKSKALEENSVGFELNLNFSNLRASLPPILAEPRTLHPVSNALARPLVAYINTHNVNIPVSCSFYIPPENFNGSWSIYECLLAESFNFGVMSAFSELARKERSKLNVTSWWQS